MTELLGDTLETGTSACLDVMHSPHPEDKGGECTASFMRCIGCPNAVVAPKHLLRLEVLRDALVRAARSTHRKKAAAYGPHIARLEHLLGQVPKPELRRTRENVTPHDVDIIERLLRGELDG